MSELIYDSLTTTEERTTIRGRVAVPSDPAVRCTREQLLSIFGGKDRVAAERDLLARLARENAQAGD